MPNATNLNKKKKAPIICAVVMIVLLVAILGIMLIDHELTDIGIIIVCGIIILTTIIGVLIALKQRLKEIESGEEEDAKKY